MAERLSSALTIYSNELTGLVILVDSQMLQSRDQQRKIKFIVIVISPLLGLAEVCELSTDFHFPELDRQLAEIEEIMQSLPKSDDSSSSNRAKPGDVYLTRHANLQASEIGGKAGGGGGIEVIFHVVAEDEGSNPSLSSHLHAAIGTVLRFCSQHDINTLSLPLLFTKRPLEVRWW